MTKLTNDQLNQHLWRAADILRGSIDASDYKNYIFGFLFLKRLSDVFEEEAERIMARELKKRAPDKTARQIAWEDPDEHPFFVPPRARWSEIRKAATKVLIRNPEKRWGSCDKNGSLRFNWHIVMAPMSLLDYVVAHELCHLKSKDHSEAFWKAMRTLMPDYEARRDRLRREGNKFSL